MRRPDRSVCGDILNPGKNLNGFSELKSGGKEDERAAGGRKGGREGIEGRMTTGERTADVIPLKETNRSLGRNRKEIFQSDPKPLGAGSVSLEAVISCGTFYSSCRMHIKLGRHPSDDTTTILVHYVQSSI